MPLQVSKRFPAGSKFFSYCKRLISLGGNGPTLTGTLHGGFWKYHPTSTEFQYLAQVDRLVNSAPLNTSDALSKLLRYLAHHSLRSPADHLKEHQIATEVLGRATDFDPQTDACVRVQIGRLRNKLAEYYTSTGMHDSIIVTIPKGGYSLSFEHKTVSSDRKTGHQATAEPSQPSTASLRQKLGIGLALLFISLVIIGGLFHFYRERVAQASNGPAGPKLSSPALKVFWSQFLHDKDGPFVIYSNAAFVGDPLIGMHYYDPSRDSRDQVSQYYTGVGEVMGAVELDQLFNRFGQQFRLKREGLFTLDDALNNDLIFLGSSTENPLLADIPNTREFVFRRFSNEKSRWWDIVNVHPRPGEPSIYRSTLRPTNAVSEDFAVIALVRGVNPSKRTLILAGISTLGTQAVVDYLCSESSVKELLRQLDVTRGMPLPLFEALIRIKVVNDVPLESQLIDLRKTSN